VQMAHPGRAPVVLGSTLNNKLIFEKRVPVDRLVTGNGTMSIRGFCHTSVMRPNYQRSGRCRKELTSPALMVERTKRGLWPLGSLRPIRVASKQELKERITAVSRTLIATLSSTHGPSSSPRPPDMIRIKETLT
jgi:hypothetical protein